MSNSHTPKAGRPKEKVRAAVRAYADLADADRLFDKAEHLQRQAWAQLKTAIADLSPAEMEHYVHLVEKNYLNEE